MAAFAKKAAELVQEIAACDEDQLLPYNVEGVNQVLSEVLSHHSQLVQILQTVRDSGVEWDQAGVAESAHIFLHHQVLLRNKRCLLAYLHSRMSRMRQLRWQLGAVLPAGLQEKLSNSEKEYLRNYSDTLANYMMGLNLDLTVDMLPPKDPYIQVRVLQDAGTLVMGDSTTHLEQGTVHLLRRPEAEPLIRKGMLEHREY